jgi:N,N'-diacetyllegionaminate synthase
MIVLGVILARAGSKGLPDKCVRDLLGRPVIAYTFDHALASRRLTAVVLSTDSVPAKMLARAAGIEVIDRPDELAVDTATVDAAARHAVEVWEARHGGGMSPAGEQCNTRGDEQGGSLLSPGGVSLPSPDADGSHKVVDVVVLLYGNIPVRAEGLIDRAVEKLIETGADSVRSVAPVSKQHPDWIHRLDGDRMIQFRPNSIYRRQDLEPLYYHDGAVVVMTRKSLFNALKTPEDHQSFLGSDRRAIVQGCDEAVDIDEPADLVLAEAILRNQPVGKPQEPSAQQSGLRTRFANADSPVVCIGDRAVGCGLPTFVIAEAGVNHNGDLETALRMVDVAALAGADAVKFQVFQADELVTGSAMTAAYQRVGGGTDRQQEMLRRLELPPEDFRRVKQRCEERGVHFLATPFGVSEVALVCALGVPAIKVASTDLTNVPLLEAVVQAELPIIMSTGAATVEEIDQAVKWMGNSGARHRLILLHCVSCYPTPDDAINLRAIREHISRFNLLTGLSDHTTSVRTGAWAVAAGACVLEKHFTLDPLQPGPDHAMSLNPRQLTEYISLVREAEAALGDGAIGLQAEEEDVRMVARRSVVAAVDVRAGTALTSEMLALKRPGTGLSPDELPWLVGRRVIVDIPRDAVISVDMLQT